MNELTAISEEGRFVTSGGADLLYRDFPTVGAPSSVPLLCLHGFVRNSRDFVDLGNTLAASGTRVIAPDLRGRGFSTRFTKVEDYHYDLLVKDVWDLVDHLGVRQFAVLGIALGGMIAMTMVAQEPERVQGIVLNDLGAEINQAGTQHSNGFVSDESFTFDEAVARMKSQFQRVYPELPESRWPELTLRAYREMSPGRYERDYDLLALRDAVRMSRESGADQLWPMFLATSETQVAVLRGEHSDFLSAEVVQAMVQKHPNTVVSTIPGRGHPPLLDEADSLAAIRKLLGRASARG